MGRRRYPLSFNHSKHTKRRHRLNGRAWYMQLSKHAPAYLYMTVITVLLYGTFQNLSKFHSSLQSSKVQGRDKHPHLRISVHQKTKIVKQIRLRSPPEDGKAPVVNVESRTINHMNEIKKLLKKLRSELSI